MQILLAGPSSPGVRVKRQSPGREAGEAGLQACSAPPTWDRVRTLWKGGPANLRQAAGAGFSTKRAASPSAGLRSVKFFNRSERPVSRDNNPFGGSAYAAGRSERLGFNPVGFVIRTACYLEHLLK